MSKSVKDYGAVGDGSTNDTVAIQAAFSDGVGYFPVGNYLVSGDPALNVPNGMTVWGDDRTLTTLKYAGTGTCLRNTNPVDGTGPGLVTIRDLGLRGMGATNTGAGIDIRAGGRAYYQIERVSIYDFLYCVVLDQAELTHVRGSLFSTSIAGGVPLWITSGPEWRGEGSAQYSNIITIENNQFDGGAFNVIDDGGNVHYYKGNNFNGANPNAAMHICGVESLTIEGNCTEGPQRQATSNIVFTCLGGVGGANKGPCRNGVIHGNSFSLNMLLGSTLVFTGDDHTAFHIAGNRFVNVFGRGAAIDVTHLVNSFCGFNWDEGTQSMTHYAGIHHDARGNILFPPSGPSAVADASMPYEFGDASRRAVFWGGYGTS